MVSMYRLILHVTFLQVKFLVAPLATTPPSMAMTPEEAQRISSVVNAQYAQQATIVGQPAYQSAQQLFWDQRRKRGPPTPAFSSTGLATPIGPAEGAMETETPQTTPPASSTTPTGLFQPVVLSDQSAYQAVAHSMGIDINSQQAMDNWMGAPVTTRADVLQTLRHYHSSVIRPELYNLVNQIEVALLGFDDRLLRQHRELQWMASDNRAEQRRSSALTVLLTGFPPKATPQERGFMVNWMLEQVDGITKFLKERGYNPEETGADFMTFQALTTDPSTPPAGPDKWSTITLLHFKSWEIRKCFMDHYGGSGGTPYWSNATTPVRNTHIRATPASPQFQRKLEIPLRVVLSALNLVEAEKNQVTILWKTLTIMMPQTQREFDEQATAIARLHYTTESGNLVGTLEVNPYLWDLLKTTPPSWAMADEETTWEHAWNKVVFGVQHELDVAEREMYSTAQAVAKGSGKGMKLGRPPRHWTAPTIFSSEHAPFPIELKVNRVEALAYVWDEYCDKHGQASKKCGDYKSATYAGAPAPPPATTPAS